MKEAILLTDGYKLDHRRQYPEGTEYVYSNWTPRSCHYYPEASEGAVVFGIQYFIKEYLMKQFQQDFFDKPKDVAVAEFKRRVDTFLGPDNVGTKHIEELHDLGYLPIRIKALPEGTLCPIRVPALTFINTHPDFFWLTNYFETLISTALWLPMTSATTARLYKKELMRHARKTGFKDVDLNFLIHDFSMRGMAGVEAAIMSGMGHMTSFCGSETIPAIAGLEEYYNANAEKELIAATIPATEHSVMCAGGKEDELETFKRLITEVYPTGFVSVVSDTWDFWKVMTEYLPKLKDEILARDGRLVIRPDSGDPNSDVICSKVRDPKTGQLSGFKIENPEVIEKNVNLPFVVIDDLCDGGGTFKGIAQLLGFHYPDRERTIYVTHMVNPKGIATLSENYKEVYFTNSYKDWNKETLPDNVKVIEIV